MCHSYHISIIQWCSSSWIGIQSYKIFLVLSSQCSAGLKFAGITPAHKQPELWHAHHIELVLAHATEDHQGHQ